MLASSHRYCFLLGFLHLHETYHHCFSTSRQARLSRQLPCDRHDRGHSVPGLVHPRGRRWMRNQVLHCGETRVFKAKLAVCCTYFRAGDVCTRPSGRHNVHVPCRRHQRRGEQRVGRTRQTHHTQEPIQ